MKRLLLLFILINLLSCQKDTEMFIPDPTAPEVFVSTSIGGTVIDEANTPVVGALVQLGTETKETDQNGVFIFRNVEVKSTRAYLKVDKAGYFQGARAIIPQDGTISTVRIQLLSNQEIGTIAAAAGGDLELPGGAVITFPPNSIVDGAGNSFDGTVQVAAQYLDPSGSDLALKMPGDLIGMGLNEIEQALASFGILTLEFRQGNGDPLEISPDKTIGFSLPVPETMLNDAPNMIPLWYFDTDQEIWSEEGSAQKLGDRYVGQVGHTAFWNCGLPFAIVEARGKVVDPQGEPLEAVRVSINYAGSSSVRSVWTDRKGNYIGRVPASQGLSLDIIDACGTIAKSRAIEPLSSNVNFPEVILASNDDLRIITGTVANCNNELVSEAYVKVDIGDSYEIFFAENDGNFNAAMVSCSVNEAIQLTVVNTSNGEESAVFDLNANNTLEAGKVLACDGLDEYISYTLDGNDFLGVNPFGEKDPMADRTDFGANAGQANIFLGNISGSGVGSFNVDQLSVNGFESNPSTNPSVTVTFTAYGTVEELLTGTFVGEFEDTVGANHVISGSFRIRRDN